MHLVFWMTWWIDTYRSKDTLTRWIVGARGFSGKTRVTARSNVSHFLSVGIQASRPRAEGALKFTAYEAEGRGYRYLSQGIEKLRRKSSLADGSESLTLKRGTVRRLRVCRPTRR